MLKKQLIILFLFNLWVYNLQAQDLVVKKTLSDYCFILLIQTNQHSNNYLCAIFALTDLKVCRFPGGPLWSNSISSKELYAISQDIYLELKSFSQKMAILCLDYNTFKTQCCNNCSQNICGFALPWDPGMAYVFDDLQEVSQVSGLLIEKNKLLGLKIGACIKAIDLDPNDFMVIDIAQIDHNSNLSSEKLDDIDLLLENEIDSGEIIEFKPMPESMQKITNFFGKIVISCLMGYLDLKQKLIKVIRTVYARQ